eukprot:1519772-Prymnesium_polylepis.1
MPSSVASSALWLSMPPVKHPGSVRDAALSSLAVDYDEPKKGIKLKKGMYIDSSECRAMPCRILECHPYGGRRRRWGQEAHVKAVEVSTGKRIEA